MKKILFVLFLIFIVRLFVSCCRCSEDTIAISLNEISTKTLGTPGTYDSIANITVDSMLSSKVAFEVIVTDSSTKPFPDYLAYNITNIGFSTASATKCDCFPLYKPTQEIVAIHIFTLYKMSDTILENTEVTNSFVSNTYSSSLYTNIDKLIPLLNNNLTSYRASVSMNLYCKEDIKNDKAQFVINIELSDGRTLSAFTNPIQIITTATND